MYGLLIRMLGMLLQCVVHFIYKIQYKWMIAIVIILIYKFTKIF